MKTVICLILFLASFVTKAQVVAEEDFSNIYSISAHTSLLVFSTNLSFDALTYRGKAYHGVTTGLTTLLVPDAWKQVGGHLTYTRMKPKKRGFFETKLGLAYSRSFEEVWAPRVLPVASIGYRFQKPNGRFFFRLTLSTGLLGAGAGVNVRP
ncbi:MAG: hypothetical protein JXQ90_07810 [Cyclobacteriaceae bacterium]